MKNLILIFLIFSFFGCQPKTTEFKILQFNIWQEGTVVPGGYDAIVDEIVRLDPDFVTFSEVRNYKFPILSRCCGKHIPSRMAKTIQTEYEKPFNVLLPLNAIAVNTKPAATHPATGKSSPAKYTTIETT